MENLKKILLLTAPIHAIKATVFIITIFMTSVIIAYAAVYSVDDFITPKDKSGQSYSGSDSKSSFANEMGYGKLIDLVSLRGTYGGTYYIDRSGYVTGYSYPIADAAPRAFIAGDSVVKNYGAPAGTYGDAGGVSRAALFNDDTRSDFNIPESPTSGWFPSANWAGANGGSNGGSGGGYFFSRCLTQVQAGAGAQVQARAQAQVLAQHQRQFPLLFRCLVPGWLFSLCCAELQNRNY